MRAAYYERLEGPVTIEDLPDPNTPEDGVVIKVKATGLCLSDWHGWKGHDPDVGLPHVPGHELAGVVAATGQAVVNWKPGDRVTLPFVCGCGGCPQCLSGNHQVCDHQFQPGFTGWGSFAEYVAIRYADVNLVGLPESMAFEYNRLLNMITAGKLRPEKLIGRRVSLEEGVAQLTVMDRFDQTGVTIINQF